MGSEDVMESHELFTSNLESVGSWCEASGLGACWRFYPAVTR